VKANNAQLVPAYAYDQRYPNVVYIRDKESDMGTQQQQQQGNFRPSGIYQFSSLKGALSPVPNPYPPHPSRNHPEETNNA
jgi:hypothetical protein